MYEVEVAGPPLCIAMNGADGGKHTLYGGYRISLYVCMYVFR